MHFRLARFDALLARRAIPWPRLPSGRLALDAKTFRLQADRHPEIAPLWELKHTMDDLKLHELTVGRDGRNRTMLSAYRSKTGRNQPSNSHFVFGPAKWTRGLIKPSPGCAVAYLDYAAQEIAIAGALSGDEQLWADYASGDPYLAFAKPVGLVPVDATEESHPNERDTCKTLFLGTLYGMSAEGFAGKSGLHIVSARELLRQHRERYPRFWAWAEENIERLLLGLALRTPFGWRIQYPPGWNIGRPAKKKRRAYGSNGGPPPDDDADVATINPRSALNWPMQSAGAKHDAASRQHDGRGGFHGLRAGARRPADRGTDRRSRNRPRA
jgi:DNA polymerase I